MGHVPNSAAGLKFLSGEYVNHYRALPLPCNVIEAMTRLALLQGKLSLAGALEIGFVWLLRTGEILSIQVRQVVWTADKRQVVLSLPNSKGTKLTNVGEYVVFMDPPAVRFFHLLIFSRACHEPVFSDLFQCAEPCD